MTLAELIPLALKLSLGLAVVAVGLHASLDDMRWLLRKPGLLLRSLLAMNVILPLFAVGFALLFELNPALEVAIVALSVSPIPPILPAKQAKAGGTSSYSVAILALAALVSIVLVPASLELLRRVFERQAHVPEAGMIAAIVLTSVLLPLAAGMIVRAVAPGLAERIARPLAHFASILLLVALVPVLFTAWPRIVALIGDFTLVAIACVTLVGLAVGHALGGPEADDRTVLALSTATRHPGIAIAIASVSAPHTANVQAAVLLYLLAGALFALPYVKWRQRMHARRATA